MFAKRIGLTALVCLFGLTCPLPFGSELRAELQAQTKRIEPTWESIREYPRYPEWLADAKFGIYTHWTPQTVCTERTNMTGYPAGMYNKLKDAFTYHRKHFGDQKEFGFKDFIPMFTAEHFDAEAWAETFSRAGAKFAGPVAVHHDNFAMWDSKVTPWNSVKMGPKRDVTGELAKAIKARGMRFIATMHHSWTWGYFAPAGKYDGAAPNTWQLYGEPAETIVGSGDWEVNADWPTQRYLDQWLGMVHEVVYQYEPDMLWFDIAFDGRKCIRPEYQQRMFADYYNWAVTHARSVCVGHKERAILPYTGILDYERGRSEVLMPAPWMTDTTISRSWFYQPKWDGQWKDANWIIDLLIDIVSKNGVMMLNVAFKSDGTLIEEGAAELENIGNWLRLNGEAIYNTRPWKVYGEPHKPLSERHGRGDEQEKVVYFSEDVRFTRSKDGKTVYAILLGWPGNGETATIRAMNENDFPEMIEDVKLIGYYGKIRWQKTSGGLKLQMPHKKPCDYAYCFKLELK